MAPAITLNVKYTISCTFHSKWKKKIANGSCIVASNVNSSYDSNGGAFSTAFAASSMFVMFVVWNVWSIWRPSRSDSAMETSVDVSTLNMSLQTNEKWRSAHTVFVEVVGSLTIQNMHE